MTKNKMTREEAISVLNHVVEYYDMNYDTGEEESTTEETNNAWDALEVLINEKNQTQRLNTLFYPGAFHAPGWLPEELREVF